MQLAGTCGSMALQGGILVRQILKAEDHGRFSEPEWQWSGHCAMTSLQSACYLGACTRQEDEIKVDVMDRLDRKGT